MSLIEHSKLSRVPTCCHSIQKVNCKISIKIAILLTLQFSCMVNSLTRPGRNSFVIPKNGEIQQQFHDKLNSGKNRKEEKSECQMWTFFVAWEKESEIRSKNLLWLSFYHLSSMPNEVVGIPKSSYRFCCFWEFHEEFPFFHACWSTLMVCNEYKLRSKIERKLKFAIIYSAN